MNAIADETLGNYEHVFNTNVRGTLLCMRAEMRHFVRQNGGVIVNNTSIMGPPDSPAAGRTSPPNMRSKA
jgi:NAD(P)-dependent dehydrogenase (short-subunit alcohol dehydrogenase family)